MLVLGLVCGLVVSAAMLAARSLVRVEEGHVGVLTTFGAAEREREDGPLRLLRPGLHMKMPWQRVHSVSMKEQNLELSGEHDGLTIMADDGTLLRFDSVLRYRPLEEDLAQMLFGMERPHEHIPSLFSCLLRNEIANFQSDAEASSRSGAANLTTFDFEAEAGSYAIIRRERRALNERIEKFTSKEIGSRYGVRFHAVDLTDILPPDELADALNAVISAQSIADAEYFHAEGEQQKRTLAAREGVDIARRHAHAEELEIDQLGTYLRELHERGVLHDYVERRRAEVTAESRAVFFNQGAS